MIALCGAIVVLWAWPPDLIRIGAGYTAKTVCSNVFLAGRDAQQVLRTDVQAPGHPLLRLMRVDVDRDRGSVRAGLFGFIGPALALVRPRTGCAVIPAGDRSAWPATPPEAIHSEPAPPEPPARSAPAVLRAIGDERLVGPGMRAVVVVSQGGLLAERYAPGFDSSTPQLGWSMTKSVTAALIGVLIKDGRVTLDQTAGLAGGGRERVTIADLMSMTSGLQWNEGYGSVSDVTRMLYLEPDMARFAGSMPRVRAGGEQWNYSSGGAVLLARTMQRAVPGDAVDFVRQRLFTPLGMRRAVLETDAAGTFVGSSYLYATPREWARFGQLLVQDGVWEGREILPRGFVALMAAPVAASGGEYGRGMVWRWPTAGKQPGVNPAAGFGIPPDAFWMTGHDGQYVAIVPSRQAVIVRMGLTPAREHYRPEPLVAAVLAALP